MSGVSELLVRRHLRVVELHQLVEGESGKQVRRVAGGFQFESL